jgi:glycosyltransferase involved in cell wall biosynthesis
VRDQPYFNKSAAQNIGAHHTHGEVLFFCDCDIVVNPDEIVQIATRVSERPGCFGTLRGVREESVNSRRAGHVVRFGYELNLHTADGRSLRIIDSEEDASDGTRDAPGLLVVRRADFLAIDGYNARLHGWGWEDQDMIARLTLGAGLERVLHGTALHLSHDDDARMRHYPQEDRWESRDKMFRRCLANYDRADFQGTYRRDVAELPRDELTADAIARA